MFLLAFDPRQDGAERTPWDNLGNIKFYLQDTLRITKIYVRKIYHPDAWEPYLSTSTTTP